MWLNNFSINKSIKRNVISVCDLFCNLTQTSEANFKKGLSKLLLISCAWKGACDRKRPPERPSRAAFFFFLGSLLPSAASATLGLGDTMRPQTPHARAKFLVHDVMMFTDNFCVTFFPHEREPSPLETVKSIFRVVRLKVYC